MVLKHIGALFTGVEGMSLAPTRQKKKFPTPSIMAVCYYKFFSDESFKGKNDEI